MDWDLGSFHLGEEYAGWSMSFLVFHQESPKPLLLKEKIEVGGVDDVAGVGSDLQVHELRGRRVGAEAVVEEQRVRQPE